MAYRTPRWSLVIVALAVMTLAFSLSQDLKQASGGYSPLFPIDEKGFVETVSYLNLRSTPTSRAWMAKDMAYYYLGKGVAPYVSFDPDNPAWSALQVQRSLDAVRGFDFFVDFVPAGLAEYPEVRDRLSRGFKLDRTIGDYRVWVATMGAQAGR